MALSENARKSLMPSFLYTPSSSSKRLFDLDPPMKTSSSPSISSSSSSSNGGGLSKNFFIPAPSEKIEMFSPAFYAASFFGGGMSTGITHTAATPMDVLKCNMQVQFEFIFAVVLLILVEQYFDWI